MKKAFRFFTLMLLLVSDIVFSASTNTVPIGVYSYTQEGDELIDGQKESITWNIMITDSSKASVNILSWHAPFTCEGSYTISNEKDYIYLTWSSKDNIDLECYIPSPQILLKKSSSGKILIHSKLFPWDAKGWKILRKIN
ncbi:TPA: hypothetical protein QHL71_004408 [Enterobacter hormaechei subsp. steigerwaltii]|nr:hypothetical protein [Enterobacter hormaechei subsp. steigerwaltii]